MLKCNHNFIVRLINYLHLRHYKNTLDCDFTTQIAEMGLYLKVLFTKTASVQLVSDLVTSMLHFCLKLP